MEEKLDDRYQLNKVLGEGGMAVVYQATDLLLNRPVAVKILKKEFASDQGFIERIRREARAVARLSHPHIVSIYDMGQDGNKHYIVMEKVSGNTLKNFIANNGKLSPELALQIARQISSALIKAHENNIIHCDIKPHNILITDNNKVKVTDFGIARAVNTSQTLTLTDSIEGSAHYFSPEQAQGGKVGPATDVYSLGVVLYEMITGEVPFTGDTPISVAVQHVQGNIPDLSEYKTVPEEIDTLIKKAMAKDPRDRFSNARELKNNLEVVSQKLKNRNNGQKSLDSATSDEETISKENATKNRGTKKSQSREKFWGINKLKKIFNFSPIKYLVVILLVFIFVIGGVIFAYNLFMDVPVVQVPEVTELQLEEGQKELSEVGLEYNIAEEVHHPEIPSGHIVQQQPEAETEIRQTRTVQIYVSSGPEKSTIPDLTGANLRTARIELESKGYEVGETLYEFSDLYAQDEVIKTDPQAGEEYSVNQEVDMIISMGPSPSQVEVPGIIGLDWRKAQEFLQANNLRLGGVNEEKTSRFPRGLIIDQSLAPGRFVSAGRSVDVTISAGLKEDIDEDDINSREISFTAKGEERAEYKVIVEDDIGHEVVWQKFLPPDQEVQIEIYSVGSTRYQIMREEEIIYNKIFD